MRVPLVLDRRMPYHLTRRLRPEAKRTINDFLVGYWRFSNGLALDMSGNNNNGTISGATPVDGFSNFDLYFDGTDDYVSIPHDASLTITDKITIEAWIYPLSVTGNRTIIAKYDRVSPYPANYIFRTEDDELKFLYQDTTNTWRYFNTTGANLTTERPYLVQVVHEWGDPTKGAIYVNGISQTITAVPSQATITTTTPVTIGTREPVGLIDMFYGIIGEVRLYSGYLMPASVARERFIREYPGRII